jgi:hypothetical protein
MYCQMIRVISSPSSSTTGLVTLIFAIEIGPFWNSAGDGGVMYPRYSTANAVAKAKALCSFSPSFGLERRRLRQSPADRLQRLQASRSCESLRRLSGWFCRLVLFVSRAGTCAKEPLRADAFGFWPKIKRVR